MKEGGDEEGDSGGGMREDEDLCLGNLRYIDKARKMIPRKINKNVIPLFPKFPNNDLPGVGVGERDGVGVGFFEGVGISSSRVLTIEVGVIFDVGLAVGLAVAPGVWVIVGVRVEDGSGVFVFVGWGAVVADGGTGVKVGDGAIVNVTVGVSVIGTSSA